jgi:SH3 domain protein
MNRFVLLMILSMPIMTIAEPIYVDDKAMAGLHQDKSVDSPIIKVLPSGTTLEIIKRDTPMSQVKEPAGTSGWMDNKYLVDIAPGRAQLQSALDQISKLEAEIAGLKSGSNTTANTNTTGQDSESLAAITKENEELKQLLKSERLRIGELQTQTAELRNKLAKNSDNDDLMKQLDALAREKAELEKELNDTRTETPSSNDKINLEIGAFDWKKMLISIAISLFAGFIAGLFMLDWINRRKHGGFRI